MMQPSMFAFDSHKQGTLSGFGEGAFLTAVSGEVIQPGRSPRRVAPAIISGGQGRGGAL